MSRRARALVARVPCLDRATAERAALGYPVDWSRYVDEAGEPRDVALPPATI